VDFTDVHATLLAAAGVPIPDGIDGRSFLPALTGTGALALRPHQVWFSPDRNQSAVLAWPWKGVWMRDTLALFNLANDPGEQTDLVRREPAVAARLASLRRTEDGRRPHPRRP
jgi:arylsulfatase A-like enzyme